MFVLYTSKIIILVRAYSWHKDALKKKRKKKIKKKEKKEKEKDSYNRRGDISILNIFIKNIRTVELLASYF